MDETLPKDRAMGQGSPPLAAALDVALTPRDSGGAGDFNAPPLHTPLTPNEVVERVGKRSKAGKLAGYTLITPASADGATVRVLAFGGIYDHELICAVTPGPGGTGGSGGPGGPGGGSTIAFDLRVLRKMPIIAAVMIIVTIFPGLPLTHSMLSLYFDWYTIQTWWWYMPLVVLMLPMMWKQYKMARREALQHAQETIGKLRAELDAA